MRYNVLERNRCAPPDGARTSRGLAMEHARIPYLALDPDTEAAIRADRAAGARNPHAFPDEDVARREDKAHDRATLTRPAFARDIEKILNVPPTTATPAKPRCSASWRTTTSAAEGCTCSW